MPEEVGYCAEKGKYVMKLAVLESKTDHEYEDKYIDHLEPYLPLLPAAVVEEIYSMPNEIGVNVTPMDH